MASKTKTEEDLGMCDNHPEVPAVHATDGTKFETVHLCKACLERWHKALSGPRRG